jgi:hypothetical protein
MKIFKCTIESNNSCYVETLLVVAEAVEQADSLVKENQKNKWVKYTQPLTEIKIDLSKPQVVNYFGWGSSDNDNNFDD